MRINLVFSLGCTSTRKYTIKTTNTKKKESKIRTWRKIKTTLLMARDMVDLKPEVLPGRHRFLASPTPLGMLDKEGTVGHASHQ